MNNAAIMNIPGSPPARSGLWTRKQMIKIKESISVLSEEAQHQLLRKPRVRCREAIQFS
jgi:hypothetical protein